MAEQADGRRRKSATKMEREGELAADWGLQSWKSKPQV